MALRGLRYRSVPLRISRTLLLLAAGLLCLNATATLEAGFTLQISYVLVAVAIAVSPLHTIRGWRGLPALIRFSVIALVFVLGVAVVLGQDRGLSDQLARSTHRDLAYFGDALLGLGLIGLSLAAFKDPRHCRWLVWALAVATIAAAAYALYQWFAQHYYWPLADINTAPNSDGFTTGHRYQGEGAFGWERARGTFKEPLFLAVFVAAGIPLVTYLSSRAIGWTRLGWFFGLVLLLATLAVTASSLAWAVLAVCVAGSLALAAVYHERSFLAGVAGVVFACLAIAGPFFLTDPSGLARLTGRSSAELQLTSQNRLKSWDRAIATWQRRPVLGFGPGQSGVRLAYVPDVPGRSEEPRVLGSAQGLWAAALVDSGIAGLWAWMLVLGGVMVFAVRATARRWTVLLAAALCSMAICLLIAQLAGDRLDLRAWFAVALLLAVATQRHSEITWQRDRPG